MRTAFATAIALILVCSSAASPPPRSTTIEGELYDVYLNDEYGSVWEVNQAVDGTFTSFDIDVVWDFQLQSGGVNNGDVVGQVASGWDRATSTPGRCRASVYLMWQDVNLNWDLYCVISEAGAGNLEPYPYLSPATDPDCILDPDGIYVDVRDTVFYRGSSGHTDADALAALMGMHGKNVEVYVNYQPEPYPVASADCIMNTWTRVNMEYTITLNP